MGYRDCHNGWFSDLMTAQMNELVSINFEISEFVRKVFGYFWENFCMEVSKILKIIDRENKLFSLKSWIFWNFFKEIQGFLLNGFNPRKDEFT